MEGRLWVKRPLLGWSVVSVNHPPIAQATLPAAGGTVEEEVAEVNVPLGTVPVLAAKDVSNGVEGSARPEIAASATSHVAEATLLNGLVRVKDLVAHVDLTGPTGGPAAAVTVTGTTYIQEVEVSGNTLRFPAAQVVHRLLCPAQPAYTGTAGIKFVTGRRMKIVLTPLKNSLKNPSQRYCNTLAS